MRGRINSQPTLFSTINIEEFVPQDHYLRKLDKVIDLNIIRKSTDKFYSNGHGRPAIPAEIFFRTQIIYYLYGIKSERQLCEQLQFNLAYRWFCRIPLEDEVPHHSSLSKIRSRFGEEVFKEIFEGLIKKWVKEKVVNGDRIIADGSLLVADASLDSTIRKDGKKHKKDGSNKDRYSNSTHQHVQDKEAQIVGRPGFTKKLCYKTHYSIDAKSRIILDCYGTPGATPECTVFISRIDYIKNNLGLSPKEVLADSGYGSGAIYKALEDRGIRSYIPLHRSKARKKEIRKNGFSYDKSKDRIKCPKGHYLYPHNYTYRNMQKYRMVGGHCNGCPMEDKCLSKTQQHRALTLDRGIYEDYSYRVTKRQESKLFKKRLNERKWKVEGLFGKAKRNHGLHRLKYRGLKKVSIQMFMTAIVQNLKRVANKCEISLNESLSFYLKNHCLEIIH